MRRRCFAVVSECVPLNYEINQGSVSRTNYTYTELCCLERHTWQHAATWWKDTRKKENGKKRRDVLDSCSVISCEGIIEHLPNTFPLSLPIFWCCTFNECPAAQRSQVTTKAIQRGVLATQNMLTRLWERERELLTTVTTVLYPEMHSHLIYPIYWYVAR